MSRGIRAWTLPVAVAVAVAGVSAATLVVTRTSDGGQSASTPAAAVHTERALPPSSIGRGQVAGRPGLPVYLLQERDVAGRHFAVATYQDAEGDVCLGSPGDAELMSNVCYPGDAPSALTAGSTTRQFESPESGGIETVRMLTGLAPASAQTIKITAPDGFSLQPELVRTSNAELGGRVFFYVSVPAKADLTITAIGRGGQVVGTDTSKASPIA